MGFFFPFQNQFFSLSKADVFIFNIKISGKIYKSSGGIVA